MRYESPNKPSRVRGYAGSWLAHRFAVWINGKSHLEESLQGGLQKAV